MTDSGGALGKRLKRFIGLEAEPPVRARDEVNRAMIRAWCDAVGDHHPSYRDDGDLAPPSMIMCWFFPAVGTPRPPAGTNLAAFTELLREHGFVSVVATDVDLLHQRYARIGDRLTLSWTIGEISAEKRTSLGNGFFLRTNGRVTDQDGALVCAIDYSRLYFSPAR